jgi:hypothetical protein
VRLLSSMNSALHTGELTIGNFAARNLLRQELESFEAEVSRAVACVSSCRRARATAGP